MTTEQIASVRVRAAQAYVRALRTGEPSATERAAAHLAEEVALVIGDNRVEGAPAVRERITGQWPLTPVFVQGAWSDPVEDGDTVKVGGTFPGLGAAPAGLTLTFSFDAADRIREIRQETKAAAPPETQTAIPDHVRGIVNNALGAGFPIVVAYVDESGQPVQAPRGSTQVYSPTQLSVWVRNAGGGLASAVARNPRLSLLYRDSRTRTTLIFQGRGRIVDDEAVRARVFELSPEVEQNHDPQRKGAALLIDVDRLQGTTPAGAVRVVPGG
ncbi:MAG: nuclear transport factor 2 family protein [Candidatus Dormibacteraeota bacterium]|nr:nuclear transport factor 2 family protein [Candidatus Dormibacteraeota bacterium]MBO0704573.1 nuclear transport factor 2 family protein [Candidatus Dormibacteraeota bacterium]MBO0761045.1 nuclear transport factor 2 family protein [Candidatus Dormibacteraeota bacterium]